MPHLIVATTRRFFESTTAPASQNFKLFRGSRRGRLTNEGSNYSTTMLVLISVVIIIPFLLFTLLYQNVSFGSQSCISVARIAGCSSRLSCQLSTTSSIIYIGCMGAIPNHSIQHPLSSHSSEFLVILWVVFILLT